MSKVAVTGAAGFIGSHVCRALVAAGYDVVGVDNFDPFYPRRIKEAAINELKRARGFALIECDVADIEVLQRAIAGSDVVIHLAGRPGVRDSIVAPEFHSRLNAGGTLCALEAARKEGVQRFVFASSSSVYGDAVDRLFREDETAAEAISPYGASKRAAELLCDIYSALHGIAIASLRLFSVYGPGLRPDLAMQKFSRAIDSGEPLFQYGSGDSQRDYTFVSDVVRGVLEAVSWTENRSAGHEIFNLGTSRPIALSYLIGLLGDLFGRTPIIEVVADQPGDVRRTCADISKSKQILGYDPQVTIEEGLPLFMEWFREQNGYTKNVAC